MIAQLVDQIESRFAEVSAAMSDPDVVGDRHRLADAGREFSRLEPAAKLADLWRRAVDDDAGARELLAEGEDPEARAMLERAREDIERLEE
jgi:peptide chain release factor 1